MKSPLYPSREVMVYRMIIITWLKFPSLARREDGGNVEQAFNERPDKELKETYKLHFFDAINDRYSKMFDEAMRGLDETGVIKSLCRR